MNVRYILEHVEVSMIITAAIGMLGMIYEPGPVPFLMALIGGVYLIAYWIGMAFFSYVKYEQKAYRKYAKELHDEFIMECPKAPRETTAKCYFYDLKKEA